MNKEKEIEEMLDIVIENLNCCERIEHLGNCKDCNQKDKKDNCALWTYIVNDLVNKGYGKVEEYKKEIERLKEKEALTHFENLSNDTRIDSLKKQLKEAKITDDNGKPIASLTVKGIDIILKECIEPLKTVCPVCGGEMDETEHSRQYCYDCEKKIKKSQKNS